MSGSGGSKTIERVGAILAALETAPVEGLTTAEIAAIVKFDRATTYRALVSMDVIGLVDRDVDAKRFRLGGYLFRLGAKTASRFSVLTIAREALTEIAREFEDTAVLAVPNKFDSVCIARVSGSYPIKAQTLAVGDRLPLGVSAGGLAILSTMDDVQVRRAIQYNTKEIATFHRVKPDELYQMVRTVRTQGYASYLGKIVSGMGAIALPIRGAKGRALGSLSVAAILDRLKPDRVQQIVEFISELLVGIEARASLVEHDEINLEARTDGFPD